ncbi:MAG: PEGA domain-containing protein [Pseudomonadota bacterium]
MKIKIFFIFIFSLIYFSNSFSDETSKAIIWNPDKANIGKTAKTNLIKGIKILYGEKSDILMIETEKQPSISAKKFNYSKYDKQLAKLVVNLYGSKSTYEVGKAFLFKETAVRSIKFIEHLDDLNITIELRNTYDLDVYFSSTPSAIMIEFFKLNVVPYEKEIPIETINKIADDSDKKVEQPKPETNAEAKKETSVSFIQIKSKPKGAEVFVDNKSVGLTPRTLKGFEAGIHLIELICPDS